MRKRLRAAAIAAVLGLGLLAPVPTDVNPAAAGVSLGDSCGD